MANPLRKPFPEPDLDWQKDWVWWQRGVIYQIYPRSFQDSDGDGCGDLRGIVQRLDHLTWLGVDAIWISPFYPSPMKDFGYDVSDYTAVHPLFGTMDDFDELLAQAHARGLKVILDLVPNHTSDEHPWFRDSASSRGNPKRNWYIWSDPAPDGGPPNNWRSEFGGSAWQWHEPTGQYYYHAFLPEQPDLNWRNADVREAMYEVMRFWLDKGVDGFRVDVMWHMMKDEHMRDNPPNPNYDPATDSPYRAVLPIYSTDQPEVHEVVREMRRVVDEYEERLLIGEIYLPIENLVAYYGDEEVEAHLPFNFQLIGAPWDAGHVRGVVDAYEATLREHDWPNWVLGNHDKPRLASRVGRQQARAAAMLLLTLRGTPTLYNGEELGMENVDIPPELVMDPPEKNCPGRGLGRDPERTPMQWNAGGNAGFTSGKPWLPLAPDFARCNVEEEKRDPASFLALYRRLLQLRRAEPALAVGGYQPLSSPDDMFVYLRRHQGTAFLVLVNFASEPRTWEDRHGCGKGRALVSSLDVDVDREVEKKVELRAHEALLVRLHICPPEHPRSNIG